MPKFSRSIGSSIGWRPPVFSRLAQRLGGVLPSLPVAVRRVPAAASLTALVPVKTARKADGDLTIRSTVVDSSGRTIEVDRKISPASEFAADAGVIYRVPLGDSLAPGNYTLVVTASMGKHEARRALAFIIVPPGP